MSHRMSHTMSQTRTFFSPFLRSAVALAAISAAGAASAVPVDVTVTIENLAPANSVSFAPLRLGFNNGSFDAFNIGDVATAPIISIAEGGSGSAWLPAFAAADPTATIGSIDGALLPGQTRSATFSVDSAVNAYFTFAAMVVPSNDFFIGNDSPTAHRLLNADGTLALTSISQTAGQIWDAGSESFDPAAAAFVVGANNDLRTPQNSVVSFNFAELYGFNGAATAGGYTFNNQLTGSSPVYRISFAVAPVPEPSTYALLAGGLLAIGFAARRRTRG